MIRTQISFDEDLFKRAKAAARKKGVSLSELCRRGLAALLARDPSQKPWMAYAGIVQGRREDSASVDSVVYDRESP
jgi:hypothetical protein